ncbi:MAG: hypothetical protein ACLSA6_12205 [Holdemania massiliensis]
MPELHRDLGSARCLYLAIRTAETVYGVVGIALKQRALDPFETILFYPLSAYARWRWIKKSWRGGGRKR